MAWVSRWVFILCFGYLSGLSAHLMPANRDLQGAYIVSEPYSFHDNELGWVAVKGLDVELLESALDRMGYSSHYRLMPWTEQLKALEKGEIDFMISAFKTPDRERYAYFSEPYRDQVDQLYFQKKHPLHLSHFSWPELAQAVKDQKIRLGVVKGYVYAAPEMVDLFENHAELLHMFSSDQENVMHLNEGKVDAIIMDRILGSTLLSKMKLSQVINEASVPVITRSVHVMFSQKTVTPEEVLSFNEELSTVEHSGLGKEIIRHYMIPLFTQLTTNSNWFYAIELLAIVALAIPGLILARSHGYDPFGAWLLAAMPGLGGGILRDLLVARYPFVLRHEGYVLSIFFVWGLFWSLSHISKTFRQESEQGFSKPYFLGGSLWGLGRGFVVVFDALGYSAFTVVGVVVAVQVGLEPLWLWGPLLATITACGGGILRDLLHKDAPMSHLRGGLVPELSLVWGFILAHFLVWETDRLMGGEIFFGIMATLLGMFFSQLWIYWAKWKSPKY